MGSFLSSNPKVVIILSGKRKSGKDYVANLIQECIPNNVIIRNGEPIKSQYAKIHNLNFEEMLTDSQYKEQHRLQMVTWSTEIRKKDPDYFLRISIKESNAHQYPVWIFTDARRLVDIKHFEQTDRYRNTGTIILRVRISASDQCRAKRGYKFTPSVDDAETECGLDDYQHWDLQINNEDLTREQLIKALGPIFEACKQKSVPIKCN